MHITLVVSRYSFVLCATDYEIKRHIEILESGGVVEQETRSFDKRKK